MLHHRKRYLPADLEPYPLHYAIIQGQPDLVRDLLTAGRNPYEPIQDGDSALHVALAEEQSEVVDILLQEYKKDFELVGEYLVERYQHDPTDRFWIKRSILVAESEDQCRDVKKWEMNEAGLVEDPKDGILVLLRHPIDGEHAAVLRSSDGTRLQVVKLIRNVFNNGLLSWISTGPAGYCETLLNQIASLGYGDHLEELIEFGVDLDAPGLNKRTPFLAACSATQDKVVNLLLRKYIDRFDPLACDELNQNGLHYLLLRNSRELFHATLEPLINYRMERCNESQTTAFNSVLNYEFKDFPDSSVWSQLDGSYWNEDFEVICERFQYDVSYQWENVTVLVDMINYNKVRQYCNSQVRKNRQLLELRSKNGTSVLHVLVAANELELIRECYSEDLPRMRTLFENDAAFQAIYTVMHRDYLEMLEFILEKHCEFCQQNIEQIETFIVEQYASFNCDKTFPILERFVPKIEPFTRKRMNELNNFSEPTVNEYDAIFEKLNIDFPAAVKDITSSGKTIDDYSSPHGRCILHQAIAQDLVAMTEHLLNSGVNQDYIDVDGRHAIHHVRSIEMLHLLLRKHPDGSTLIHRKARNGLALLHVLCADQGCSSNKEDLILELLKLGVDINALTDDQATALYHTYDVALFEFLTQGLESRGLTGINVDSRDFEGNTALHRHLRHQNGAIAAAMLRVSRSFVSFNDVGDSYLAFLVRFDRDMFEGTFKPILEANPEKTTEMFEAEFGRSKEQASKFFVEACSSSLEFCIVRMLKMDLDFNARACGGMTAVLFLLGTYEVLDPKIVVELLEKPVDVNLQYENGYSALLVLGSHFTRMKNQGYGVDMVRRIIQKGALVNLVDYEGNSALHHVFKHMELDFVVELLDNGADWQLINRNGKRPYELAPRDICDMFSSI